MTSFTIDADDHIATATGALKPQGADHFTQEVGAALRVDGGVVRTCF
jgi:hypothetical protein